MSNSIFVEIMRKKCPRGTLGSGLSGEIESAVYKNKLTSEYWGVICSRCENCTKFDVKFVNNITIYMMYLVNLRNKL
jgi:hypothetical protein